MQEAILQSGFMHQLTLIATLRLIIRPPRSGDGGAVFEATSESLAQLRLWPASLPWALKEPSLAFSEAFCRSASLGFAEGTDFRFLFFERETGRLVGAGGLHRPTRSMPDLEIGWWGRTRFGGSGFVTEAGNAILKFGFDTLFSHRIFALPDDENLASCRICERLGMTYERLIKGERTEPDGTLRNSRLYAVTREVQESLH